MGEIKLPLGIDLHVHFRTPGDGSKETLKTGYTAALAGGIGTVLDMPNTVPPVDNVDVFLQKEQLLDSFPYIHQIVAITNSNIENGQLKHLIDYSQFFKLFMANSTGDLAVATKNYETAFEILNKHNSFLFIHAEDPNFILERTPNSKENETRPETGEIKAIEKVIELADNFRDMTFHLTHVSTSKGAELILDSKRNNISWDCLAKHLKFDESMVSEIGNYARMNPPLRSNKTLQELRQFFIEGKIPVITSDHAPHTVEDKKKITAGAPGVQELYLFLIDELLSDHISQNILKHMIYKNPKEILDRFQVPTLQGEITVDTDQTYTFDKTKIKSKCGWSLWENYEFNGKIIQS